jgi:hypothetical protein
MRWTVNSVRGGRYRLRIRAISPDGSQRRLRVGEDGSTNLQFPSTAFRSWDDAVWVEVELDLKAGRTTLTWSGGGEDGPQRGTYGSLVKFDVVELVRLQALPALRR